MSESAAHASIPKYTHECSEETVHLWDQTILYSPLLAGIAADLVRKYIVKAIPQASGLLLANED